MQNDLFEKWYSLSFPNSSLERNEDGSYFRRKTNFSLESFKAGQQSKQKEIDQLKAIITEALSVYDRPMCDETALYQREDKVYEILMRYEVNIDD
jgi:hypothetical protein